MHTFTGLFISVLVSVQFCRTSKNVIGFRHNDLLIFGAVRLMVSTVDKIAETDLLGEKNIVPWLIRQADKLIIQEYFIL